MSERVVFLPPGCTTGQVSDGYHTFDELYEHRHLLFIALMQSHPTVSWCSLRHEDGSIYKGWFIAGMHLGGKSITYLLPEKHWQTIEAIGITILSKAPTWDKNVSTDIVKRLEEWIADQAKSKWQKS